MLIVPLLVLGVVLWLIFRAGDRMPVGHSGPSKPETAREVLDRRYAAGEINREDYQRMKQDLA
ncbi:MAG: SHOCT domain-containing protein [Acidiphilium sp.]|nr:SHOCT domain-containing protein [Acidiphilium sp.]MDD4935075.1 SHOCT domain-containing protein [Acidiphilium sp.]